MSGFFEDPKWPPVYWRDEDGLWWRRFVLLSEDAVGYPAGSEVVPVEQPIMFNHEAFVRSGYDLFTVEEIAKLLIVKDATVRKLIQAGELRAIRLGKTFRIYKQSVLDFIAMSVVGPDDEESEEGEEKNPE